MITQNRIKVFASLASEKKRLMQYCAADLNQTFKLLKMYNITHSALPFPFVY